MFSFLPEFRRSVGEKVDAREDLGLQKSEEEAVLKYMEPKALKLKIFYVETHQ